MDQFGSLLSMVILAAIILLGLCAMVRDSKLAGDGIRRLAATHGLQCNSTSQVFGFFRYPTWASGQWRGKYVELFKIEGKYPRCAVTATVPVGNILTFHLSRQGFDTNILELFGAKEIQTGDPVFDTAWFIRSNQPEFFREALLPELRAKIMVLAHGYGGSAGSMEFRLDESKVGYWELGSFSNQANCRNCERAMDIVCDLADVAEVFAERHRVN